MHVMSKILSTQTMFSPPAALLSFIPLMVLALSSLDGGLMYSLSSS